jgi:hypothetical protein
MLSPIRPRRVLRRAVFTLLICLSLGLAALAQSHTSTLKTVVPTEKSDPL